MSTSRDYATWLFWRTGLAALARAVLVRNGRFALVLHGIVSKRYSRIPLEAQPYMTVADLRALLRWLKTHFALLTLDEFLSTGKPGVLLTFDDGMANNCTNVLPILEEYRAPAVFFVSTQHVVDPRNWLPAIREHVSRFWRDRSAVPADIAADLFDGMSTEQLARCASSQYAAIGSHTVSHAFLTQCSDDQVRTELAQSKRMLEDLSGRPVDVLAYPTGDYDARVAAAARDAGYQCAFAVDPSARAHPAYEIPRVGIYAAGPGYLAVKLSGMHRLPLRGRALRPQSSGISNVEQG